MGENGSTGLGSRLYDGLMGLCALALHRKPQTLPIAGTGPWPRQPGHDKLPSQPPSHVTAKRAESYLPHEDSYPLPLWVSYAIWFHDSKHVCTLHGSYFLDRRPSDTVPCSSAGFETSADSGTKSMNLEAWFCGFRPVALPREFASQFWERYRSSSVSSSRLLRHIPVSRFGRSLPNVNPEAEPLVHDDTKP